MIEPKAFESWIQSFPSRVGRLTGVEPVKLLRLAAIVRFSEKLVRTVDCSVFTTTK